MRDSYNKLVTLKAISHLAMASLTQNSLVLVGGEARKSSNKRLKTWNKKGHFSSFMGNYDNSKPTFCPLQLGARRQPTRDIRKHWKEENWKIWSTIPDKSLPPLPPVDVVLEFYDAFNAKDIQKLEQLLLPNCVYQDWDFYNPFEGKENIINFLSSAKDAMGQNIHIHVDSVSDGEHLTCTVFWHLEWEGIKLPYTNGCRFFAFEEHEGKLIISKITGVDELPIKPGEVMLILLKFVSQALERYPLAAQALLKSYGSQDGTHEGVNTHL